MSKPKTNPLLAALIGELPPAQTQWPVERQLAWLHLTAQAFGVVYGGDAAAQLANKIVADQPKAAAQPTPPAPPPKPAAPVYPFIIDQQNFVRKGKGKKERVLPGEVTDIIYDLRGMDGDIGTVVWADDSVGVNGRDLTITVG